MKLGVSNGIINFVFGVRQCLLLRRLTIPAIDVLVDVKILFQKLDSFLDSKTKALSALDEANKVKNAAYGIDAKHSATSKFISELVAAKIKAASGSIGPVINSASTFINSAKGGLAGAFASKLAPLSSIAGGLSAAKQDDHDHHDHHHEHDSGLGKTTNSRKFALIFEVISLISTKPQEVTEDRAPQRSWEAF